MHGSATIPQSGQRSHQLSRLPYRLIRRLFLALILVTGAAGCTGGGARIPDGWQSRTVTFEQFAESMDLANPLGASSAGSNAKHPGRLQIIICYGSLFSDHTALRLVSRNHDTDFWDPAGSYGVRTDSVVRQRDVLIEGTPDLRSYWQWRQSPCHNEALEIFEWEVPEGIDSEFHQLIREGLPDDDPHGPFSTYSHGMMCCISVSGFLRRFGGDLLDVPRTLFWPHELAAQLRTQHPDAVIILRAGENRVEIGRPARSE